MKKLFTLVALLTCFLGAMAEEKVDVEVDLTTVTADTWQHGWVDAEGAMPYLSFDSDGLHFHNDEAKSQRYEIQFQPFPGVANLDNDAQYTITIKIKGSGSVANIGGYFSGSDKPGDISVTSDWQTLTFEGCQNNPDAAYFANSGSVLIQCGDFVGDWWISYVKITHEEKAPTRPVEWLEQLTNGNAETAWPAWSLEKNDEGININWRGDKTGEICAWALQMGTNMGDTGADGSLDGRARPFPANIVADPDDATNHVFMVDASQVAKIDDDNSIQWANQFWIQSPKGWTQGTKVKLHFRYKAENAAKAATQIHKQHPSDYLHWQGVGDVSFTDKWQDFDKEFTFDGSQATGWSVAFNLNAESTVENPQPANKFYFDDLSWQVMKLDNGWFVASANTTTGIEYDFDNAPEMVYDEVEDAYVATVGTVGKKDTWVNQVMISTVRGETASFKGATIKPTSGMIRTHEPDNWQDYSPASQAKIDLPAAGVWQIFVAPYDGDDPKLQGTGQIFFTQLEGDAEQEPVAIVKNETELVIKGVERDDLKDNKDNDGKISVREDADDPAGVEVGGEGHEGQTWDNQFFIVANRELKANEETIIEFDFVATADATCGTSCQGDPGAWMGGGIDNVNFTTSETSGKFEFKSPKDGVKSIAIDLACIKAANTYTIKNVKWYLKSDYNAEDKTMENLINAEGTDNFYVKIGAGTSPYKYGTDPSAGINNVVNKANTGSAVIYNLAGQRVSKDYKGIVIKNGKKVVVK